MRSKADIVAGLPFEMDKLVERRISVPDEIRHFSLDWSALARESIDSNNLFGMGTLLTHMGSRIDEPNELDKLIIKLENPKISK